MARTWTSRLAGGSRRGAHEDVGTRMSVWGGDCAGGDWSAHTSVRLAEHPDLSIGYKSSIAVPIAFTVRPRLTSPARIVTLIERFVQHKAAGDADVQRVAAAVGGHGDAHVDVALRGHAR